jgi:hypothetical protein
MEYIRINLSGNEANSIMLLTLCGTSFVYWSLSSLPAGSSTAQPSSLAKSAAAPMALPASISMSTQRLDITPAKMRRTAALP